MDRALFRQEVIDAHRDRLMGSVVAATPPSARVLTWILGVAFALMIAVVAFGQFASRAKVTGVVAYDHGIARVYPPAVAEVRAVHVREGQVVAAGAPLLTISLSPGRNAEGEGVDSQIAQIGRRDGELARQQQLAVTLGVGETASLEQQRDSLRAVIASLKRQRGIAVEQVKIAESDRDRADRLLLQSAGTRRQADESKAAFLARQATSESTQERILTQQESLRTIEQQIAQRHLTTQQTVSQIAGQRADLAQQRASILRLDSLTLTAPVAGRIGDLNGQPGHRARPDASLVTVVPENSRLEAWLYTPTRSAGFVHVGQDVRLLFDAYPFQKYGAGKGHIVEIARVPADPGSIDPGLKIDQPVFRIRVSVDRGAGKGGDELQLKPGMTLAANLVLERRSLWEVFLDPILRALRQ